MNRLLREALKQASPALATAQKLKSLRLPWDHLRVIAIGKAAEPMAAAAKRSLAKRISKILIISPKNADHPIPTSRSLKWGKALIQLVTEKPSEPILCLISGGASAMAAMPASGISFQEKISRTKELLRMGVPIQKLNSERKKMSAIKGGKLFSKLHAPILSLIVSDVMNDPLNTIASGLTVPSKPRKNIRNILLLPSSTAADQLFYLTKKKQFRVRRIQKPIRGDAFQEGYRYGGKLCRSAPETLWISYGETTVQVKGMGRGGRNLEFALGVAKAISGTQNISLLSVATDGVDGNSGTAGAFVDETTWERVVSLGMNPKQILAKNNSALLFKKLGDALPEKPSGLNFSDVQLAWVGKD